MSKKTIAESVKREVAYAAHLPEVGAIAHEARQIAHDAKQIQLHYEYEIARIRRNLKDLHGRVQKAWKAREVREAKRIARSAN